MEQSLIDAIQSRIETVDGIHKLSCTAAHEISDEQNVSPKIIGDYCTAHKIKISACELGCFK